VKDLTNRLAILVGVGALGATISPTLFAADEGGATIDAGPLKVQPTLDTELGYIDNLFRSPDDEENSLRLTLTPALRAFIDNGASRYEAFVEVREQIYYSSSNDDATDVEFGIDVHHAFSNTQALDLFGGIDQTHEERGTGLSQGGSGLVIGESGIDAPIKYDETQIGARYTLGNNQTLGRLELEMSNTETEYKNFRDVTAFYDYDEREGKAALYYNLSGKSALLLEGRWEDTDYARDRLSVASKDSEENTGLVGITWQATAKTTGYVKIGFFDRKFDDSARDDADGFRWDVSVTWAPRTYSTLTFSTAQESEESNGFDIGDYIERERYGLAWLHQLGNRTQLSVSFDLSNDEYANGAGREDDRTSFQASLERQVSRWAKAVLGFRFEEIDSDNELMDYERNEVFLGLQMTL